jgi:hypothetical protein
VSPRAAYLDGVEQPLAVRLDGPALLVLREAAAPLRLPFRRIARLVVRGAVAFEAPALAALLRQGIGAAFLAGDGSLLGALLPETRRAGDLAMLVDLACELADWPDHLAAWRAAEERRALLDLAQRLRLAAPDPRPRRVRRWCLAALEARLGTAAPIDGAALLARLEDLLRAELLGELPRWGLGPSFADARVPERDMAGLLHAIERLALMPAALELAAYLRDHPDGHRPERRQGQRALQRRIATRFEAEREGRDRRRAQLLGRLQRRLLELLR